MVRIQQTYVKFRAWSLIKTAERPCLTGCWILLHRKRICQATMLLTADCLTILVKWKCETKGFDVADSTRSHNDSFYMSKSLSSLSSLPRPAPMPTPPVRMPPPRVLTVPTSSLKSSSESERSLAPLDRKSAAEGFSTALKYSSNPSRSS